MLFTRGMSMAVINFLSDIRNAAIANAVIVVFHIYIAFAVEGVSFLVIVLPIGVLIAMSSRARLEPRYFSSQHSVI